MEEERTIKIKSKDNAEFELSSKAAERSNLLKGMIADFKENTFDLNNIDGKTLEKVKDYLVHYIDKNPSKIEKPLKSNKFEECAEKWDVDFLGDDDDTILSLLLAANYLDIEPLLDLTSAKIACSLKGTTTENVRKEFKITDLNKEEKAQIESDKNYLEQILK